jgi:hypothetical protein
MKIPITAIAVAALAACGSAPDARYPSRPAGCPVKQVPGQPTVPVDDLGTVQVDCTGASGSCERKLLDAVCARGGDTAWGLADNAITATTIVAHAAHSRRFDKGPREHGCAVQVYASDSAPLRTENIGAVEASCDADDSKDVCLRELEDQVCQLGGDVLWQVEGPVQNGDRKQMRGRAAHTKP